MGIALPDQLALLATDEPYVDLYCHGPWRVPDGIFDRVDEAARRHNTDDRAPRLPESMRERFTDTASCVALELVVQLEWLIGGFALRAGTRADLQHELLSGLRAGGQAPLRDPVSWFALDTPGELPGGWLLEYAGTDRDRRQAAYDLAGECLTLFDGLAPFEPRRTALQTVHELGNSDPELTEAKLSQPLDQLRPRLAELVDDTVLAVLPELAGPVSHLEWAVTGLSAAHGRLTAANDDDVPHGIAPDLPTVLAELFRHAELPDVPADLGVVLDAEDYLRTRHTFTTVDGASLPDWQQRVRNWLGHAVFVGELDACRSWLDMATRIICLSQNRAGVDLNCRLPTAGFQADLRARFRRRAPVNPLAAPQHTATDESTVELPGAGHGDGETTEPAEAGPGQFDAIVGQRELTDAFERILSEITGPAREDTTIRLLLTGPEGSGRRTALGHLGWVLTNRKVLNGGVWLSDHLFTNLNASDAVSVLDARITESTTPPRSLLIIDGLDQVVAMDNCGAAVAEELRRQLRRRPDLHLAAVCRAGGDLRVFDANPALFHEFRVARTREFTEDQFGELTRSLATKRGAAMTDDAVTAAATLLARTAPLRNLRGARLAAYLVETSLAAAAARDDHGRDQDGDQNRDQNRIVTITAADLPERLFPVGAAGSDPYAELDECVGMGAVKREVRLLVAEEQAAALRRQAGIPGTSRPAHLVLTGGPGTGKTMVARLLGRMFAAIGVLSSGHLVAVDRADLSDGGLRRAVTAAMGGVLCVEDAHNLVPAADRANATETLVAQLRASMQQHPTDLLVVLTGPDDGVNGLLRSDPELAELFGKQVRFGELSEAEFVRLFEVKATQAGFVLGDGALNQVRDLLRNNPHAGGSGRARVAMTLLERAVAMQARRILADGVVDEDESLHELLATDIPRNLTEANHAELTTDPMTEIDKLIGLEVVKREVRLLVAEAKADRLRRDAGMPVTTPTRHLVFAGNPGTAKTTIARLLAAVYAKLGLLSSGHLVEATRGDLVAEFIGQTAPKVRSVVDRALGGILFIDEAYSLTPADSFRDFGMEAVAELLRLMEEHRNDLVVIVAGYTREMDWFIKSNPGLTSRFPTTLRFPDYSDDELIAIFASMADAAGYRLHEHTVERVRRRLRDTPRDRTFGNGRVMRNLFDRTVALQAKRITQDTAVNLTDSDRADMTNGADRPAGGGVGSAEVRLLRPEDLPERDVEPAPVGQYL